jgi:tetratricopeptide (TPR) repeat protein
MGMMKGSAGALVLLLAVAAHAQPSETEQLRKHFEDGSKAFNLGEFKRAVDEYKAAYNIRPDPVFLYNIAQAYRLDGNLQQALFFYKSYLTNSPKAPNRREVEGRIHELDQQIAQQKTLTTAPPTGTVAPSGVGGGEPSTHGATATPPPAATTTAPPPATTAPPPATTAPPPSTPPPAATTTSGPPALTATAPEKKTPVYKKWWLWTAVGVVAVGAAVGVGLAVGLQPSPPNSTLGATRVF